MKIVSWNVNGIKARYKHGFTDFIQCNSPDVLCLQEIKLCDDTFCKNCNNIGYSLYWNICSFKPAYSGTAIFSKQTPLDVVYGLGQSRFNEEARNILFEFESFFILNVYMPNAEHKLTRVDYRREWDEAFSELVLDISTRKPIIICGDFNCTLRDEDIRKTLPRTLSPKFSSDTRYNIETLMREAELVDAFRWKHPDAQDAYTWWSIRKDKRKDNVGWRLDYFLVSEELSDRIIDCGMHGDVYGSDHCPIVLEIMV